MAESIPIAWSHSHMPRVSVVIPCYNQGHYLQEAIQSVLNQDYDDMEIIIVNDGSTDIATLEVLQTYTLPHIHVLHTDNQGLSSARNNGIAMARGQYILPLDADDAIAKDYVRRAVAELDANPQVGIVYGEAEFMGAASGRWNLPPASLRRMLTRNVIFHAAFFRKMHWEMVGGYKTNMRYGLEDWDFWVSLLEQGGAVTRLDGLVYFYRIAEVSMTTQLRAKLSHSLYSYTRLMLNHKKLYMQHPLQLAKLLAIVLRNCIYHTIGYKVQR
ncbi:MAG: glycosyltransferase [Desulfovibrio sp.]|nr:glycosyltransferase [Desulfovibrio sp.]